MPGRKRILDETRQREICALISAGCDFEQAARYTGCSSVTIRRESVRNPEFFERLRQAKLAADLTPLQAMRKAAGSHWRAAAWLLERLEPERFVRHAPKSYSSKEIKGFTEKIVDIIFAEVDDPEVIERIVAGFSNLMSDAAFNIWAQTATRDQFRQAFPKVRRPKQHLRQRGRNVPNCAETASDSCTSARQNETDSTPILSDTAHELPTDNSVSPLEGTTE